MNALKYKSMSPEKCVCHELSLAILITCMSHDVHTTKSQQSAPVM